MGKNKTATLVKVVTELVEEYKPLTELCLKIDSKPVHISTTLEEYGLYTFAEAHAIAKAFVKLPQIISRLQAALKDCEGNNNE